MLNVLYITHLISAPLGFRVSNIQRITSSKWDEIELLCFLQPPNIACISYATGLK